MRSLLGSLISEDGVVHHARDDLVATAADAIGTDTAMIWSSHELSANSDFAAEG